MTDPTTPSGVPLTEPSAASPIPGERRLARPPSDRYRASEAAAAAAAVELPDPAASVVRGVAVATAIVVASAGVMVLLGGVVTFSAGLIVVAAASGWAIAQAFRVGARELLGPRTRQGLALAFALAAIALGQAGLWLYARAQGGVLPPLDYLWDVYGGLIPVEFLAAGSVAWFSAR